MADGILLDGLEIQGDFAGNGLRFTFASGGLQSKPSYRGEDDTVPSARGRAAGQWIQDVRDVALRGIVTGTSRPDFRANAQALIDVMRPSSLIDIEVHPPNFGLSVGEVATLANCRPLGIDGGDPSPMWYEGWEITLRLRALTPTWSVSSGLSYLITPGGDPMFTPGGDRLYVEP